LKKADTVRSKDLSVVVCGAAGQGIKTVEEFLVKALKASGYHVYASREYMSRVRGGSNSTEIRIGAQKVTAFVDRIDVLIVLSPGIRANVMKRISPETLVIGENDVLEKELSDKKAELVDLSFVKEAMDAGGKVYANAVASGVIFGILDIEKNILEEMFESFFSSKGRETVQKNLDAMGKGFSRGREIAQKVLGDKDLGPSSDQKGTIALDGSDAISLGALAGGCNFIASYPMSPATGVLSFLAASAREYGVVAEQIEDEMAAINCAVGASYAGARSMVTTSGGGFALMSEGLSLAGVMETPVVVHLAQRPGPATGMATRTEQADLNLALYSGHGEFPRILLAPATIEDGFYLMKKAFNLADKFQVPVILLTDQYFLNTFYDVPEFDVRKDENEYFIVEAGSDYRRYEDTESGISPRSVPGYGKSIVGSDSHEHDACGHVQEDFELRERMVQKRLRKEKEITKELIPPIFDGKEECRNLVLSWGSTYPVIREGLELLNDPDTSHLHLRQLCPLDEDLAKYLEKAENVICIEGNATGQLCSLVRQKTGYNIKKKILNYRGLQFSAEEICKRLGSVSGKGGDK